jgi:L-malate glycosyltransferase
MKIGILTSMAGVGGTENVSARMMSLLRRNGHTVKLIAGSGPLLNEATAESEWWNLDFYGKGIAGYIRATYLLCRLLQRAPLDIIHCQMARPVLAAFVANLLSGTKAKIVWHSRGLRASTYAKVCPLFDKLGVFAIGNCKHERAKLVRHGYRPERTFYTYNPLPPWDSQFAAKNSGPFTLGSLSRLSADRRVDEAILILKDLLAAGLDARLVIAGNGPERRQLEDLVTQLGLAHAVDFLGVVRQLSDFFSRVDVLVNVPMALGDDGAGVGNNILEAAQFGVPVVTYDSCGIAEMVRDGYTGYCVAVGHRDVFVDNLLRLARQPALRLQLGTALNKHVASQCSDARIYEDIIHAYEMIRKRDFCQ